MAHKAEMYPYQKALSKPDQTKLEDTWTNLTVALKDKYKVWVKSCVPEDDDTPPRAPYWIPVTPKTPVIDIVDVIRAREKKLKDEAPELSDTDDEYAIERRLRRKQASDEESKSEKPLKLIYGGQVMRPGTLFGDYGYERELWKWSKPFAGVIWISPYHVEPGFAKGKYF